MPREAPVTSAVLPVRSLMSISLFTLVGWPGLRRARHGHRVVGSCSAGSRATEQQRRGDQAQDGEPGRRSECGLVAGALRNVTILTTPHSVSPGRSPAVNRQLGYTGVLVTTRQHRHGVQLPERGWHDWADDGQRADRGGPAGAAGPGPGLPGRVAAGGPYGNGRRRWAQLARRGSR